MDFFHNFQIKSAKGMTSSMNDHLSYRGSRVSGFLQIKNSVMSASRYVVKSLSGTKQA